MSIELEDKSKEKTVSFVTLGCKVNQTESQALAQMFRNAHYKVVDSAEASDVVVINTCTVTNTGDSKSRQVIRRMIKTHPDSFVVVMGCYAQTAPGEVLNIEGVDLVIGTQDRSRMIELIEQEREDKSPISTVHAIWDATEFEELPLIESESRTRATLKIQEGCNQFCTYCIIPYARGSVRSRRPENALAEARKLVEAGYKEIVLTGIHTGAYGQDLNGEWDLARLVKELIKISGLHRLRLSSIEPMEFTDELINIIITAEAVCPHLHIPLQSGSDSVLSRMKRPYTTGDYLQILEKIREKLPHVAITSDIIVGFPGESENEHKESVLFVDKCKFSGLHVFPYSKRKGTPAADYPDQLPKVTKDERVREMLKIARKNQEEYVNSFAGKTLEVLIEAIMEDGRAVGHTANYIQLHLPPNPNKDWVQGDLVNCILDKKYFKL